MAFENITVVIEDRVAHITLNRPDVHNSLDAATMGELDRAFHDIAEDSSVGAIIVTGAGEMAFAAGADISELAKQDPVSGAATAKRGQRIFRFLETMGKPSIAAVNGFALGGGCELAMACSIRIASDKAKFGQPEVNLGIIPGYAGTQRLPRLVGKGIATDLILTGRIIKAEEALRIGLVTQIVPRDELVDAAKSLAQTLLSKGPVAIQAAMDVIDRGFDLTLDDGCNLEATQFGVLCSTDDMKEGLSAFLEKRKANFKGK